MAMPSFASPQLSDASITYSVRGYYSQYLVTPSYTANTIIHYDGSVTSTSSFRYTSDYFRVYPGGSFAVFYDNSILNDYLAVAFFDSSYNVVSGGFNWSTGYRVIDVPSGAYYARLTQRAATSVPILSSQTSFSISNYSYLFAVIDDIFIDSDGHITIPYQTYSYTSVFLDFDFYSNNFYAQSFTLDVFSYLTASYINGKYLIDYLDGTYLTLYRYFNDASGSTQYEFLDDSINNPASFNEAFNNRVPFRGFRLYIPISYNGGFASVSSNLHIELSNFMLDSHATQMVQEIKSIQELLSDYSLNHLTDVSLSDAFNNIDYAADTLENTRFRAIFDSFYGYGIIPTLIVLSLSIAFLGYLLYGKSG